MKCLTLLKCLPHSRVTICSHKFVKSSLSSVQIYRSFQTSNCYCNAETVDITLKLKPYVHPTLSYAQGLSSIPYIIDTFPQLLDKRALEDGNKTCLVSHHEGISKTFKQLRDEAYQLASSFHYKLGLSNKDIIGIWSLNSASYIVCKYAADYLGSIQCTINPYYKIEELAYTINHSKIKVLIVPGTGSVLQNYNKFDEIIHDPQFLDMISESNLTDIIFIDGEKKSDKIGRLNVHLLSDLMAATCGDLPEIVQNCDDPNILMYTSGTTGKPKGASVSQFMVINNAYFCAQRLSSFASERTICCPLPLFHSFAFTQALVSCLVNRWKLVLPGNRFDPRGVSEAIIQNQCNLLECTPTMALDLMQHLNRRKIKLDTLTGIILGGALSDVEVIKRLKKEIPTLEIILNGFGATELSPCATLADASDPEEHVLKTVGRPLDHLECKIVDPRTEALVKHNEKGELCVRGFTVMLGYLNDEAKTREAITPSRWYKTGDIAEMNNEGYFNIVGRIKELIIRGGENIYPQEIENFLLQHKSISEAYVFGIPDARFGEEICSWIKLKEDAEKIDESDVRNYLKERVTYFKVPKHIFFVKEFPLTSTFKASKLLMQDITINKLLKKGQ